MSRRVFVDTSAWLAVMDTNDSRHSQAVEVYTRLLESQTILITTILVVGETHILLRRKVGQEKALIFLNNINTSPRIEIVYPDAQLEIAAKVILRQHLDQDFSLTDAISFALMRKAKMEAAFAYDRHFATAGFTLL